MILRVARILYTALFVSLVAYAGLAHLLVRAARRGGPDAPAPADPQTALPALVGIGLVLAGAIPLVRRRLLPAGGVAVPDEAQAMRALARYVAAQVVGWALCEAIAVCGLVASALLHDVRPFYGFAAVAAAGLALTPPRAPDRLGN